MSLAMSSGRYCPFWDKAPNKSQVQRLWDLIAFYYQCAKVPDRLDGLTAEMIKAHGKQNKAQRGNDAAMKCLLHFCNQAG